MHAHIHPVPRLLLVRAADHDKYKLVGQVREPTPPEDAEEAAAEAEAKAAWESELLSRAQAAESGKKFRPFRLR